MSAATPGVLTTSNRANSVTLRSNLRSKARGWPIPPLAPSTATLKFLTPILATVREYVLNILEQKHLDEATAKKPTESILEESRA